MIYANHIAGVFSLISWWIRGLENLGNFPTPGSKKATPQGMAFDIERGLD